MLVATSETRLGTAGVRSSLFFERAVRGAAFRRELLAFDTKYAAGASGKPDSTACHLFILLAGRIVTDRGEEYAAPAAVMLADDEMERPQKGSRTFRSDGANVDVIQLRMACDHVSAPIGLGHGPVSATSACWDAANALLANPDAGALARTLDALATANVVAGAVTSTVISEEPERFRRLWEALKPLYETYGATASLKQLASNLGMSMRQVGRDAKEMSAAFGIGGGYRDALLVVRLRMAVLLLSAPEAGVAEVAKLVGYGSPIALARAFRDAKLPSPSVIQAGLRGE